MLIKADARALPLRDGCVQCCVTSPPYFGLRDYGAANQIGLESTPDAYVRQMVDVFREVRRVLKDDGTVWLNLGDSYARAGGWASNDGLDGMPRGESGRARTNMTGTGNQRLAEGCKSKDLIGIPWRVAFALQADGWYLRSDIIWHKPNPMPESVTDRPTKSHEYLFLLAKSERYYYDAESISETATGLWSIGGDKRRAHVAATGGLSLEVRRITLALATGATSAACGASRRCPTPAHTLPRCRKSWSSRASSPDVLLVDWCLIPSLGQAPWGPSQHDWGGGGSGRISATSISPRNAQRSADCCLIRRDSRTRWPR